METVIMGGDFNIHINPLLDKVQKMTDKYDSIIYRKELISFLETNNLVDIWRIMNPDRKFFTWHRNEQKSRLDYFFVSEHLLNTVVNAEILPSVHSDHCLLTAAFTNIIDQQSGRGFWKFNSSLLYDDEYVANIKEIIRQVDSQYKSTPDKRLVWELLKLNIRNFTIPYCVKRKKKNNQICACLFVGLTPDNRSFVLINLLQAMLC